MRRRRSSAAGSDAFGTGIAHAASHNTAANPCVTALEAVNDSQAVTPEFNASVFAKQAFYHMLFPLSLPFTLWWDGQHMAWCVRQAAPPLCLPRPGADRDSHGRSRWFSLHRVPREGHAVYSGRAGRHDSTRFQRIGQIPLRLPPRSSLRRLVQRRQARHVRAQRRTQPRSGRGQRRGGGGGGGLRPLCPLLHPLGGQSVVSGQHRRSPPRGRSQPRVHRPPRPPRTHANPRRAAGFPGTPRTHTHTGTHTAAHITLTLTHTHTHPPSPQLLRSLSKFVLPACQVLVPFVASTSAGEPVFGIGWPGMFIVVNASVLLFLWYAA